MVPKRLKKLLERATEIALRNKAHLDILNVIDLKQFSVSFGGMVDANGDAVYQTFEDVEGYLSTLVERVKTRARRCNGSCTFWFTTSCDRA